MFVVLVTDLKKKAHETQMGNFWNKMYKQFKSGKAEMLYCCNDTSADSLIRKHARQADRFKTYILLPVDAEKEKPLTDTVAHILKKSLKKIILETTECYEVVVNQ
ncbi:hypothetical protein [Flavobacterium akiainvivens]|nr:hypothetical protein [Flavobacterium akiainvivens]SFQ69430.1 hypothetical protein SAMN05444144_11534 [Flavobacterium akiainvivens]